jgi:hypothetical protein
MKHELKQDSVPENARGGCEALSCNSGRIAAQRALERYLVEAATGADTTIAS